MRTKEKIFKAMLNEMPWKFIGEEQLKPYILEAMQIYADEYYNAKAKQNENKREALIAFCEWIDTADNLIFYENDTEMVDGYLKQLS